MGAQHTALTDAGLDEFVRHQVPEIVAFLTRHLRQGSLHAIRLVKYEDLHADPHRALRDLLGFAGLDFSDEEIADAVQFASFENLRKLEQSSFFLGDRLRATDPEDPNSYKVRQGRVGGYREALQPATLAEMERYVAAHLSASFDYTGRAGIIS